MNGGRNMVHKKTVTTPVTETKYTASDGLVFKNEDEAELHEKLLESEKKVKKMDIKNIDNAYFCRTPEEYAAVIEMLAYKEIYWNCHTGTYMPGYHYEGEFAGEDWYFFVHETEMDYPDTYYVETLTKQKKEFADCVNKYESVAKKE